MYIQVQNVYTITCKIVKLILSISLETSYDKNNCTIHLFVIINTKQS